VSEPLEPLGLALQRIREARGLTVEELAERSGVAASTIKDAEQGESTPRTDTIARLARPLGLTFEEVWSLQGRRE
jgi:transcriptional regulator with XRE-family HTH domain